MCACVCVYQSATDVVGCTEIFGRQRGLTQSRHEAAQRRKLWCVHTYVDPDWTLTIQLTAALEAWQREANRYLEQTGEIWGTAAAHIRAGCNLILNSTRVMVTRLRCSRWDFDGHHWWILGRVQQVYAPEESRPHICMALRQRECVCCLVVFGAGPGQRSSKHWMSSSELSESQAVITPRSPTHSRQLTTPVTTERHVCVCVWLKGRKGGVNWEGETKWKTRSMCASSSCASCLPQSVYAQPGVRSRCERRGSESCRCVCRRGKEEGAFFLLLFLPPSLLSTCQSYSISHPSIFHFNMQLQMWRQSNIKLQKRACICKNNPACALPWPDTHVLTLSLSQFWPPPSSSLLTGEQCGNTCSSLSYCVFK